MQLHRTALFAFALSAAALPCAAATQPVFSEALQQEAMSCVGEATQICPEVLTADDHGLACMVGKRQSFSPRCRVIYDKVAKVLASNGLVTVGARRP